MKYWFELIVNTTLHLFFVIGIASFAICLIGGSILGLVHLAFYSIPLLICIVLVVAISLGIYNNHRYNKEQIIFKKRYKSYMESRKLKLEENK